MRLFLLLLTLCGALSAQMSWKASQVVDFVRKSAKTSPDRDVAQYLNKITLTDQLSDEGLESCLQAGAGPRTRAALFLLREQSSAMPPAAKPAPVAVAGAKPVGPAAPSEEEKAVVLQKVTEYARGYIKNLPNFTCTQVTKRFSDASGAENYRLEDTVLENLSYLGGKESYVVKTVNNTPTTKSHWELGGTTSSGEFGTDMAALFDPGTHTEFTWDSWTTWSGRRTHRFAYRVLQTNSSWTIEYEKTQHTTPGYTGFVYVDREFNMIMRITRVGEGIPADFPIQNVRQDTRYSFQKIGDREQEFLVPLESLITSKSGRYGVKNETRFTLYRKFGTESVFKPDVPEEPIRKPN